METADLLSNAQPMSKPQPSQSRRYTTLYYYVHSLLQAPELDILRAVATTIRRYTAQRRIPTDDTDSRTSKFPRTTAAPINPSHVDLIDHPFSQKSWHTAPLYPQEERLPTKNLPTT